MQLFSLRIQEPHYSNDIKSIKEFMENSEVLHIESSLTFENEKLWSILVFFRSSENANEQDSSSKSVSSKIQIDSSLLNEYEALKEWRRKESSKLGIAPFRIATDRELVLILEKRPRSLQELMEIRGFGTYKVAHYGEILLQKLNEFLF